MNKIYMVNLTIKLKKINGVLRKCYYICYVEYDIEKLLELSPIDKTNLIENLNKLIKGEGNKNEC